MRRKSQSLTLLILGFLTLACVGCAPVMHVRKWATGLDLVEATRAVTVEIRLYGPSGPVGVGTGFIVDRRGLVVTNHHVASAHPLDEKRKPVEIVQMLVCTDANTPTAKCDKAKMIAGSPKDDLALLKVERTFSATTLIGRPRTLEEGEEVFARATIGALIGPALVYGRYVGLSREDEIGAFERPYLVLDIAANPGGSGSPVFDRKRGELIGVIVMVTGLNGRSMTMAIPVATVITFLEENDPYLQPQPPPPKGK